DVARRMSIAVFGVNHRTAPLEVRERFAHAAREVPGSLGRVLAAGARGGVLLSTCNRTEFYLTEPGDTVPEIVWTLLAERLVEGRGAREFGYAHRDRPLRCSGPRRQDLQPAGRPLRPDPGRGGHGRAGGDVPRGGRGPRHAGREPQLRTRPGDRRGAGGGRPRAGARRGVGALR